VIITGERSLQSLEAWQTSGKAPLAGFLLLTSAMARVWSREPKTRQGMVERLAQIETEARTLARSSNYSSATSIEALLVQSYREASKLFANPWTHSEIERLCEQAIRARQCARKQTLTPGEPGPSHA
jgi:hypothetical protein